MARRAFRTTVSCGALLLAGWATTAAAQPAGAALAEADDGTIIVTARRRAEADISTPVVVSTLSAEEISRFGATTLEDIGQQVPQLFVGEAQAPIGGVLAMRGVSTGTANGSSDQAISVNVDGVQVARATILRVGVHDLAQAEILRGPQALFFGKNSPGGVISLRTADPTNEFELMLRGAYEFNADEMIGEVAVSGPVTDNLRARLFLRASKMEGPFRNIIPPNLGFFVTHDRAPHAQEYFGRATILFEPSDSFRLRLKASYTSTDSSGVEAYSQRYSCSGPFAQGIGTVPGLDTCRADEEFATGEPTQFAALDPVFGREGGAAYSRSEITLLSAEANIAVSDHLTLTSITGFFGNHHDLFGNFEVAPAALLVIGSDSYFRQISQEVRLASDYEGPLNFTVGGYFDDGYYRDRSPVLIVSPPLLGGGPALAEINSQAYSVFGQLLWDVTDTVELAGGARYSHETKALDVTRGATVFPVLRPEITFEDVSPEATLTWRPSRNLTIFGAYREGFKSGGYNTGGSGLVTRGVNGSLPFDEERVRGFEAGIKSRLFDNSLRLDLTAYRYSYTNLQLTTFDPSTGFTANVTNAAASRVQGVELEANYSPPAVRGFTLRGSVAYNHARYTDFLGTCYVGQTAATGCNVAVAPGVTLQDFDGRPLERAPDWTAIVGFTLDRPSPIAGVRFGIAGTAAYSDGYATQLQQAPESFQNSFWLFNGNLRLYAADNRWELALIGRNLSNKIYVTTSFQDPLSFALPPGVRPDVAGSVNRPREIMLQLTLRPR